MPDAEECDQEALRDFLRGSSDKDEDEDDESASSPPSPPRTATQALVEDWDSTDSSPSELREVIRIFYNFLWYSTKRYRYFLYPSALPPQECRACWSQTPSRDPGIYINLLSATAVSSIVENIRNYYSS